MDFHKQFCQLVGIPPSDAPDDAKAHEHIGPKTLYGRALALKKNQNTVYQFTAAVSNSLLLAQVVLGAAVTALGASESSHVLITLFGAANTIIAGVVAYLKSRGQPMRARMYRDDLERVVDEMENSEIMWLGISKHMHGYGDIDIDKEVTVRSEVARLTRLYDRAVRNNTLNNPDMYMAASGFDGTSLALRARPSPGQPTIPPAGPPSNLVIPPAGLQTGAVPVPAAPAATVDPDESPATAAPKPPPKDDDKKVDEKKPEPSQGDKKPASADDSKPKDDAKSANDRARDTTTAPGGAMKGSKQVSQQNTIDDEPEPAAEAKHEK